MPDTTVQLFFKDNEELSDYIAQKEVGDKCPLHLGKIEVGSFQITDIGQDSVRGSVSSEMVKGHESKEEHKSSPVMMVLAGGGKNKGY